MALAFTWLYRGETLLPFLNLRAFILYTIARVNPGELGSRDGHKAGRVVKAVKRVANVNRHQGVGLARQIRKWVFGMLFRGRGNSVSPGEMAETMVDGAGAIRRTG